MTTQNRSHDVCSHKHAFWFDIWLRRIFQSPKKIVGEYVKPGNRVADIGCGPGYFSIDMAKMVGITGQVVCIDLQVEMLEMAKKKARKHNVMDRMTFHRSEPGRINIKNTTVDFILAFYMMHETTNPTGFMKEMKEMLDPDGKILVVEPRYHIDQKEYEYMLSQGNEAGLKVIDKPSKKGGRAVLFSHQ